MVNQVILMGRLTADPECRKAGKDHTVCDFSIAVERPRNRDTVDFIRCNAWNGCGEFIEKYFHKGDLIHIIGELHIDKVSGERKNDPDKYFTSVNVQEVSFCGSNRNDERSDTPSKRKR